MSNTCYCDIEPATAYWESRPIAKKQHRCNECGGAIKPADRYERVRAVWEGEASTVKTCVHCLAMRDLVESRVGCFCWEHGGVLYAISETLLDYYDDIPGLRMAIGRIAVERRRENKKWSVENE